MKFIALLTGYCFAFVCCFAQTKKELYIPNRVQVVKQSAHVQIPGTRVFVVKPKGYRLQQQLARFQKNNHTYFQVFESQSVNFDIRKTDIIKEYDDAIRSGKLPPMYYRKELKLGNYNALLYYAGSPASGIEQIVLTFGNKDFAVMATGQVPANDQVSRDEILRALLSLYVDEHIQPVVNESADYTLNLANTQFQYAGNMSQQLYFYTVGGKNDTTDPYQHMILVQTLPALKDAAELKAHSLKMLDQYRSGKIKILQHQERNITINGKYAHELTFTGTYEGRTVTTYQVVTGNNKATIVFAGNVFDKHPELMAEIKKIAQTLRVR
ncbi:hypothetical protein [uncultured Chitinophaga sp.]|jgi:hypothetical protein|uniref:hypothetical protein n=1 Tax=uncultured Chitinophaga sp. TaxID=339340 RepID=UPI002605337A|nr:hypothetical protein [uncultured Chitinophaga sp.]